MTAEAKPAAGARWLLDDLVGRVDGLDRVVVLSADGLPVVSSGNVDADDAEHLSAVASALHGLARGAARQFAIGPVRQTVVETAGAFLFVTAARQGACVAVLAAADADLGLIAYEVNLLVGKVGAHLAPAARVDRHGPGSDRP